MDNISFNESLEMVVYTIGYNVEGESLLIILKTDNDSIVYTIVIDGYKIDGFNKTYELIKEKNIKHIDVLCWTHPDEDHSLGLEDYIEFLDRKSIIIVGDGFYCTKDIWAKANNDMYNYIDREYRKSLITKNKVAIEEVCTKMNVKKIKFTDARYNDEYIFEIMAFAPKKYINTRNLIFDRELKNNDISVGLFITIGEFSAVFCADIPDVIFNNLNEDEFPEYVDFIKIPHHGSQYSTKVLKLYKNIPKVACTTVKTSSHLPRKNVVDLYKKRSKEVYCTNDLAMKKQKEKCGVIKTVFDVISGDINSYTYGNAKEIE